MKKIDEFYQHNIKLYCLGASHLDDLFIREKTSNEEVFDDAFAWDMKKKGGDDIYDEIFAWDRCLSRLKEMQTEYYYGKQHKFYKEENEDSSSNDSNNDVKF